MDGISEIRFPLAAPFAPREPAFPASPQGEEEERVNASATKGKEDRGVLSGRGASEASGVLTATKEGEDTERPGELTEEEQKQVRELKQRDTEVRQHEQAHLAAGGRYVRGGASFEYTTGPDGRRYASGGEVSIDIGKASSPEATITKAQTVRGAALAPANPSPQDRRVAAQASQLETNARQELAEEKQKEMEGQRAESSGTESTGGTAGAAEAFGQGGFDGAGRPSSANGIGGASSRAKGGGVLGKINGGAGGVAPTTNRAQGGGGLAGISRGTGGFGGGTYGPGGVGEAPEIPVIDAGGITGGIGRLDVLI